ncbi:MAG: TetR/AcrR family transcriptional regulator [Myxococcales bacterium]|nr:MAG: TetR/AcrR family transcriptional regulator [Myxococcales bacterium]
MPREALSTDELQAFRDRICEAAAHLFAERGYEAVTLRSVAALVGCSPMTPYRYFPGGKDEIFAAVRAASFGEFADASTGSVEGIDDPFERLVAGGREYVRFALERPDQYRLMFELTQPLTDHPEVMRQGERAWAPLRDNVARAIDAGLLSGDPDTVAHVVWAGVHGLVSLHLAGKLQMGRSIEDLIEPVLTTLALGNAGTAGDACGPEG